MSGLRPYDDVGCYIHNATKMLGLRPYDYGRCIQCFEDIRATPLQRRFVSPLLRRCKGYAPMTMGGVSIMLPVL